LVRVITEQRKEVLVGKSHNRTEERSSGRSESEQREKFWQGWQRDSLVCSSSGAKSRDKMHLRSEINHIEWNGDLGKKIWSKVESGQGVGEAFEMAQLICQVLKSQKERKMEKVGHIRFEEVKLPFG
jgi:hypothetical protein